jgi:hypothetical protein
MQAIWNYIVTALATVGLVPADLLYIFFTWLGVSVLNLLVGRRTQVEAWCASRPRLAGALSMLRGAGFDPWKYIDGAAALATGRWSSATKGKLLAAIKLATKLAGGAMAIVLMVATSPLVLVSCAGQQTPAVSAQQVATVAEGAVAVTDAALSVAIDALPDGADLAPWEERVKQLETVAQALREGKDQLRTVCDSMPTIRAVGELTKCAKCVEAAATIQTLACGGAK